MMVNLMSDWSLVIPSRQQVWSRNHDFEGIKEKNSFKIDIIKRKFNDLNDFP
jgi:hypothetical protein